MKAKSTGKIALGQATKDIAAKWRGLSDKEKKPYQTRAVSAKLANPPKQKATKPPGHQTGYRLFIKENFESVKARNPVLRASEVMTAMGHEWKAKSQADKDAYSAKAVEYNRTLKQAGSGMF